MPSPANHIRQAIDAVETTYPKTLIHIAEEDPPSATPVFRHKASGLRFRYIPGGSFNMGLSDAELAAAEAISSPPPINLAEMRPVRQCTVEPFLMAERPVLVGEIAEIVADAASPPGCAAYVTRDIAEAYCNSLNAALPTEAQWEYACRAGGDTLFTWGNTLPAEEELAEWLTFDFSDGNGKPNAWGLCGLFVGEWCKDQFRPDHDPQTPEAGDARTIRGGGAFFWPWQDQEWVWCMSAMRMPSTDLLDGTCGFRPVLKL